MTQLLQCSDPVLNVRCVFESNAFKYIPFNISASAHRQTFVIDIVYGPDQGPNMAIATVYIVSQMDTICMLQSTAIFSGL